MKNEIIDMLYGLSLIFCLGILAYKEEPYWLAAVGVAIITKQLGRIYTKLSNL